MNAEQLEQAKKKSDELLKYTQETDRIREYIEKISENHRISLSSSHNEEMWYDWEKVYDLIGVELIELLRKKMNEREDFIERLEADDLIRILS